MGWQIPFKIKKRSRKGRKRKGKKAQKRHKLGKGKLFREIKPYIRLAKNKLPRFFRLIKTEECNGELRIGFGNPLVTGLFFGGYSSLRAVIPILNEISIRPDFQQRIMQGRAILQASVRPIRVIPLLISVIMQIFMQRKKRGKDD